jgi:hypothetical protein
VTPACPICESARAEIFFRLAAQPVLIGVLWESAAAAQGCRRGDIDLAFCPDCGFVWNVAFDPALIEYDRRYDNSLHFSPTFQAYTRALVERLVAAYGLHGKRVVDIGCGKGDFLAMLCEAGGNFGWGFDPAHEGARVATPAAERIVWSNDHYGCRPTSSPRASSTSTSPTRTTFSGRSAAASTGGTRSSTSRCPTSTSSSARARSGT